MTDRIVEVADTAAFLSVANGVLQLRFRERPEVTVPVAEIQVLILANPAVTITGAAMAELAAAGCPVLFSGADRLPVSMTLPLVGNYLQTERFHAQINASKPLCKRLWQTIVREKIRQQALLLQERCGEDHGLSALIGQVASGDPENVEARAAVIYWKYLFGQPFRRDREAEDSNKLLNYGYAVLRAITARACCGAGLHPTLGVNHHNRYNAYCLADDLMEPFRMEVDRSVAALNPQNLQIPELTKELRAGLIRVLLEGKRQTDRGRWPLVELIRRSAEQTARSFTAGENCLDYR